MGLNATGLERFQANLTVHQETQRMRISSVNISSILFNIVQYCSILFNIVQYCSILFNIVQYCSMFISRNIVQ